MPSRLFSKPRAPRNGALIILAAGFLLLLFNGGSRFSMGLVLKPMAEELEWSRASLSLAVTCFMIISAMALPLTGNLIDRFSARRVLLLSVSLSGIGLLTMAYVETPLQAVICYGIIFALGSAGTSITPVGVLVSRVFPNRIGIANSLAISGMGVGQLVIILWLSQQLDWLGWRGSFAALGVLALVLLLPVVFLLFRGDNTVPDRPTAGDGQETRESVWQQIAGKPFLVLLLVYAVCGFQDFLVATHVVALALDQGIDSVFAGNIYALMGLMGLLGVIAAGFASDVYGPVAPTVACFLLRILIFALMVISDETWVIASFALIYGLTFWITAPLTVVFTRRLFGTRHLGTISGIITMVHHGAGGLGAYVGGVLFDGAGNYNQSIHLSLVLSLAVTLIALHPSLRKNVQHND